MRAKGGREGGREGRRYLASGKGKPMFHTRNTSSSTCPPTRTREFSLIKPPTFPPSLLPPYLASGKGKPMFHTRNTSSSTCPPTRTREFSVNRPLRREASGFWEERRSEKSRGMWPAGGREGWRDRRMIISLSVRLLHFVSLLFLPPSLPWSVPVKSSR